MESVASSIPPNSIRFRTLDKSETDRSASAFARQLTWWFCFLGPIGKLLLIPMAPISFRFYYFLLPLGIVTLWRASARQSFASILPVVPLALSVFLSAATASPEVMKRLPLDQQESRLMLIMHAGLFTSLMFFVLENSHWIHRIGVQDKLEFVEAYLCGYLISLACGYVFVFGRATKLLSEDTITAFCVLSTHHELSHRQRFCPGSYPNEYGNVSSFALAIMLLYYWMQIHRTTRRSVTNRLLGNPLTPILGIPLSGLSILLSSSRAAYISLVGSIGYVILYELISRLRHLTVPKRWLPYCLLTGIGISLALVSFPVVVSTKAGAEVSAIFEKVVRGMDNALHARGSIRQRLERWSDGERHFQENPLVGCGFSTHGYVHNVYLQLFYDMGVCGTSLFVATVVAVAMLTRRKLASIDRNSDRHSRGSSTFLEYVRTIALFHVLWFAAGNHNLDHHLTWFAVLLGMCVP